MFERFTEHARQVVTLAQEEARTMKHEHIGTEHLLLGLLAEDGGHAGRVLTSLGLSLETARASVIAARGEGKTATASPTPFTLRAQKSMEFALREALSLGHNYIGTEHLLLGLLRDEENLALQILAIDPEKVRNEVIKPLTGLDERQRWAEYVICRQRGHQPPDGRTYSDSDPCKYCGTRYWTETVQCESGAPVEPAEGVA